MCFYLLFVYTTELSPPLKEEPEPPSNFDQLSVKGILTVLCDVGTMKNSMVVRPYFRLVLLFLMVLFLHFFISLILYHCFNLQ